MPSFDFLYRKDDGRLALKLTAECDDEIRAKVLAHAMKAAECHHFEVWDGARRLHVHPEEINDSAQ